MLPTVTNLSNDGFVNEKEINYYDRRSKDVGLAIFKACYVNKFGKFFKNQLGIDDDDKIEGLKRLADVIKKMEQRLQFSLLCTTLSISRLILL